MVGQMLVPVNKLWSKSNSIINGVRQNLCPMRCILQIRFNAFRKLY